MKAPSFCWRLQKKKLFVRGFLGYLSHALLRACVKAPYGSYVKL